MRSKRIIALSILMAACLLFTGCDTYDNFLAEFFEKSDSQATVITIGVFEPLTGADAEEAAQEVKGIELAHELYPQVLGMQVELVYADNQSDVNAAAEAAQDLVDQNISVVLGSYKSVLSLAGSDIFAAAEKPAIGITCTNPIITQTNEYYFRVCFVDAFQGNSAAKYVLEHLELENAVAFKMEGDDYASAMIEQFETKLESVSENEQSLYLIEYPEGTEDFTEYFEQIQATGSSAVFFPSDAMDADEVIYQAVEGGYDFQWIGSDKWSDIMSANTSPLRDSAEYLEGVTYVADFDAQTSLSEMTPVFMEAYQKKYGEDQIPSDAVALGFDAYLLALKGIEDAGTAWDGTSIADKLRSVFQLPAATGYITLNAQGDPIKEVVIEQYKNGKAEAVFTSVPVWGQ